MKFKILIMFANAYSLNSDRDGSLVEGCTVNYYMWGENGESMESKYSVGMEGAAGSQRSKATLDKQQRMNIQAVPGIYDAEFTMTVGGDGKTVLKPVSIEFISKVEIKAVEAKAVK